MHSSRNPLRPEFSSQKTEVGNRALKHIAVPREGPFLVGASGLESTPAHWSRTSGLTAIVSKAGISVWGGPVRGIGTAAERG